MRYYPVFLDINGRHCVVVGGGKVAERKALSLADAGAKVFVISPAFTKVLKRTEGIRLVRRAYKSGDLKGAYLVIAASSSKAVNKRVRDEAVERGVLINVVDSPEDCSFIVPSVVERGGLAIAISTSGKAPALAKNIREKLEVIIGPEYEAFLDIISKARARLKTSGKKAEIEKTVKALVASPVLDWLKSGDTDKVRAYLSRLLPSLGKRRAL